MDLLELRKKTISNIHESKFKFVIVSSGGGSNAIGSLLKVPGASNSILEAYIPYAKESLDFYLMKKPESYCSLDTTTRMAARAYSAAKKNQANHVLCTEIRFLNSSFQNLKMLPQPSFQISNLPLLRALKRGIV